jgi:hypothetical protein
MAMSDGEHDAPTGLHHDRSAGSHYQPSPQLALVLLILFVASVVALSHFVSAVSIQGTNGPGSTTTTVHGGGSTTTTSLPRAEVKVQVANGTSVGGLARQFSDQLQTLAWNVLPPENVSSGSYTNTLVYYRSGFAAAGASIAKAISVPPSAAIPLVNGIPVAGYTGDDIVVILGLDSTHG